MKSYVDTQDSAITTAWTANAAIQATSINTINANLGTATTNITTIQANLGAYQNTTNANIGTLFLGNASTQANLGAFEAYANTKIGTNTNSNLVVVATTTSTGTTTGALVVAGGVGIAGALYVGGATQAAAITSSGTIIASTINAGTIGNSGATLTGTLSSGAQNNITSATGITALGTIASLAATTAVATNFSSGNIFFTNSTSGTVSTANVSLYESVTATTTDATHYPILSGIATGNTASFTAAGLVFNPSTGNLVLAGTTASTSSTTGALVVKGGAGIAGQLSVASNITLSESGGTGTRLVLSTSGSGAIINQNDNSDVFLQTQGNTRIQIINGSGIVSFPYGITANSSGIRSTFANVITTSGVYWANGAAYSSGGSFTGGYVASQSTFGANLVANSATNSTSNVTGAVVVAGAGGLGVGGNVYVGNRVGYVWGANSVSSAYTYFNSVTNSIDTVFG